MHWSSIYGQPYPPPMFAIDDLVSRTSHQATFDVFQQKERADSECQCLVEPERRAGSRVSIDARMVPRLMWCSRPASHRQTSRARGLALSYALDSLTIGIGTSRCNGKVSRSEFSVGSGTVAGTCAGKGAPGCWLGWRLCLSEHMCGLPVRVHGRWTVHSRRSVLFSEKSAWRVEGCMGSAQFGSRAVAYR